jgi:HK97 family phage major capsid protein
MYLTRDRSAPHLAALETKDDHGGGADLIEEVKEAVEPVMTAFEQFKAKSDERFAAIETALRRGGAALPDRKQELSVEAKAFDGFMRRGPDSLQDVERKALVIADDTSGGYLAPPEFDTAIIKNLVLFSPIRTAARVASMNSGEIRIPKRTGQPTARWVAERETRTGTQAAYGQATITAREMACYVDVSQELLEDAAVSIETEVGMDLAEEFGRLEGVAFVNGDGVGKPSGFMASSDVATVNSGNANLVTPDGLISILYSLAAWYRNRAVWMMNGTTLGVIRKLKDTTNQYLWQPGLAAGQPETILGRPVVEAPDMPDIGAGATPIAVGDFNSAYRIYDRTGMSVLRDPYTMATDGLVRFHARRRVGADLVKAEALRKLLISA